MAWKFCGKAQLPHSFRRMARNYVETAFPQNFHTMKLGEITVFYVVMLVCLLFIVYQETKTVKTLNL